MDENQLVVPAWTSFRDTFGGLPDVDWREALLESTQTEIIRGLSFPRFPSEETQSRIHGNSGRTAMLEALSFYEYGRRFLALQEGKSLDFGSGWGRIIRPFMKECDLRDLFGFEPNLELCVQARSLNPYVTFFSGGHTPDGRIPGQFFRSVFGWSVFSHLSPASATLWLAEMSRIVIPGGRCVFTTWGARFLDRLLQEQKKLAEGQDIHWYSKVCIQAAGSIESRAEQLRRGEFVWFTSGQSLLYGEAFLSRRALERLLEQHKLPFKVEDFDEKTLSQDVFVLSRL